MSARAEGSPQGGSRAVRQKADDKSFGPRQAVGGTER